MRTLTTPLLGLSVIIVHGLATDGRAAPVFESELNNTLATANNIDSNFTTDFVFGIEDSSGNNTSTTIPHATIYGNGLNDFFADPFNLVQHYDYFSFNVTGPITHAVFDVDSFGLSNTELYLFDAAGNLLAESDDQINIDNGSVNLFDPFLEYTFHGAGLYVIGVGGVGSSAGPGGITGTGLLPLDFYSIQTSLNAVPEPASVLLFGAATAGLIGYRRRRGLSEPVSEDTGDSLA